MPAIIASVEPQVTVTCFAASTHVIPYRER